MPAGDCYRVPFHQGELKAFGGRLGSACPGAPESAQLEMPGQYSLEKLNASEIAPAKARLEAQAASRLNQLRDTKLRAR